MKFHFTLFAAVGLAALISSDQAKAQLLDLGTTYTIEGQGFTGTGSPPNFTETVELSSSTQTFDNGKLQISVTQTPWEILAPIRSGVRHGVFAEFYIRAPRRSRVSSPPPLVSPSTVNNVFFAVGVTGVQLKVPAIINAKNYWYWNFTRNGVADAGITVTSSLGFPPGIEANPNPGSIGAGKNVFYFPNCIFCSDTPASQITNYFMGQGDNFIKNLNIDPKFNGYFVGFKLEYPPNPPPT
jgi:hypothetical protein